MTRIARASIYMIGLSLVISSACSGVEEQEQPQSFARQLAGNWPYAVTYEIFVQSFYDTNNDGIGDLPGVTEKLDYLKDLGVEAIWLMPINPSPSYHKYDVTDYKEIHPDYGSLSDFKQLVKAAHDRNIKIVIDLVVNHTSSEHPWFKEASGDSINDYRNYYLWANKDSIAQQILKKETTLDSDNITQWHAIESDSQHYYGFFWGGMPDLNLDNPQVKEEIFEIGRFWLEDMDVDGFRLDAARHIFPDDRPQDNHQWWVEFRNEMQKVKPDVFLLGEVYADAPTVTPYLEGLPALFNFDVAQGIIDAVKNEQGAPLLQRLLQIRQSYAQVNPDFIDATFLSNHDQNRIGSQLAGDRAKIRMAASLLLTLPGSPFLYYGEELGMLGVKPDEHIREPFNWDVDGKDPGETQWLDAKYSQDQAVAPLSMQMSDTLSLYNHYKTLIELRNDHPALTYGTMEPIPGSAASLCSFLRLYEQDSLWVLHNLSSSPQQVPMGQEVSALQEVLFYNGLYSQDQEAITIAPYTTVILTN
ncbi:MAG: alpha-amylase family glycosyl hydrolase [Cyclobacteriaceae bacterium]|nr:alpha-amylase family glycosyl hydrolase [Cyclobacteriaceae bacterium]